MAGPPMWRRWWAWRGPVSSGLGESLAGAQGREEGEGEGGRADGEGRWSGGRRGGNRRWRRAARRVQTGKRAVVAGDVRWPRPAPAFACWLLVFVRGSNSLLPNRQ